MILSSIQPCFIPWLGYFEQIAVAARFVYLDDVQYTKKDWRNTNRLKSRYGVKIVHVPVQKTSRETRLNEARISYNEPWEDTLLNKISDWYGNAPHVSAVMPLIAQPMACKYERLIDLTMHINREVLAYLGIDTVVSLASDIPKRTADKNARIVEMCRHFPEVDVLYDGKSASSFIDMDLFKANGVDVVFQDYQQTPYPQLWGGPFEPNLSVIDALMNCGPDTKQLILSSPLPERVPRP